MDRKNNPDDDAATALARRAEDLVRSGRWREAAKAVRAGEAMLARERPHRCAALFGAAGDAVAAGAAAEAALLLASSSSSSSSDRHKPGGDPLSLSSFPGFEGGRVLVVEPTGEGDEAYGSGRAARTTTMATEQHSGGAFRSVALALEAARDGDVLLLRAGTHRVTCARDGTGLVVDKRVMITAAAGAAAAEGAAADGAAAPNTPPTTTTTTLYHCGNAPALRLPRAGVVLRGLSIEADGFREAVLVEAGERAGKERLRQHARLGGGANSARESTRPPLPLHRDPQPPLVLLWGCRVRSSGDDTAHVVGCGAVSPAPRYRHGPPFHQPITDALLVGCALSAPGQGKSGLVVSNGARVKLAGRCAIGPCGGCGALVVGGSERVGIKPMESALAIVGASVVIGGCGGDGVAVMGEAAELEIVGGGAVVRGCGGAAVDASRDASVLVVGGGGNGGGGGGGGGAGAATTAATMPTRLGEDCLGGALMVWESAVARIGGGVEMFGRVGQGGGAGMGPFAVVVASYGRVIAAAADAPTAAAPPVVRGDAFVELACGYGKGALASKEALIAMGALRVVSEADEPAAEGRARLPDPAAVAASAAFAAPPAKPGFNPLCWAF